MARPKRKINSVEYDLIDLLLQVAYIIIVETAI